MAEGDKVRILHKYDLNAVVTVNMLIRKKTLNFVFFFFF